MSEGAYTEYQADRQVDYLRRVVLPAAERRELIERELERMAKPDRAPRRAPRRWLGDQLVRLGERLRQGAAPARPPALG
jgi:hypothetical protein